MFNKRAIEMVRARGNLQGIKETLKHLCIHVYMRI